MGKELSPKRMHELNVIKSQNEEIFEIVLGYNAHLRYDFEELKSKLKHLVEFYTDHSHIYLDEQDVERYERELENIRHDRECIKDMSYWNDLFEIYQIVFDDIDAHYNRDFKQLKSKLLEKFSTVNLATELADLEEYKKKLRKERKEKTNDT